MSGHVLIIDPLPTRRIQLQAALGPDNHDVVPVNSTVDALRAIKRDPPELIIAAYDLPSMSLPKICKAVRAHSIPVLVAVQNENLSARIAALTAGASDVIDYSVSNSEVQARIRNLKRQQHSWEDTHAHGTDAALPGLAEATNRFAHRLKSVIICDDQFAKTRSRLAQIAANSDGSAHVVTSADVKTGLTEQPDVVVLYGPGTSAMSNLLGMLRTNPETKNAGILCVVGRVPVGDTSPLDLGANDLVPDTVSNEEIHIRINRLAARKQAEDQARKTLKSLGSQVNFDALTGLHNRAFTDRFFAKLDRMQSETPCARAIIMVDVDHFKRINDNHGHSAGDAILTHIARLLRSTVREDDLVARYGGDEFVIALCNVTKTQARAVAERVRATVSESPVAVDEGTVARPTISLGLAHAQNSDPQSASQLCKVADTQLYAAKSDGRNRLRSAV